MIVGLPRCHLRRGSRPINTYTVPGVDDPDLDETGCGPIWFFGARHIGTKAASFRAFGAKKDGVSIRLYPDLSPWADESPRFQSTLVRALGSKKTGGPGGP